MKMLWLLLLGFCAPAALAEPYLAVRAGAQCGQCHASPTGGGLRTAFGRAYAQSAMAADPASANRMLQQWQNTSPVQFGANARSAFSQTQVDGREDISSFELEELRLYLQAELIPGRVLLYADQKVAPGGSRNQEAYVALSSSDQAIRLTAGRSYLPFGLRLEDDTSFVRQVSGINFDTPDEGVQLMLDRGALNVQAALSNGAAGGNEAETGKQFTLNSVWTRANWRLGASANLNDTALGKRHMAAVYAGLKTGPVVWLAEYDWIRDTSLGTEGRRLEAGLIEGNWEWRRGHNLKLGIDYFDPDTALNEDEQNRYSLVHEYTPYGHLQLRSGLRVYDGIPQNPEQNRALGFMELHAFF